MTSSRRRLGAGLSAAGVSLVVLGFTAGTRAEPQRGTRESADRRVFITALDRHDAPVTDLTPADVVVREDGAARRIVGVARPTAPLQIALLVDDSQVAQPLLVELRDGVSALVRAMAADNPGTELSVWTFGGLARRQVDFTTSVPVLTRAIGAVFARPGAGSFFMEALVDASADLGRHEAARPVIVAFLIEDSPELSTSTETTVTDALKRAGVALWTVVLQGRTEGTPVQAERRDRTTVIIDAAAASGGGATTILDRLELPEAYATVASRLTAEVEVTYARPDGPKPPSRLDVTVRRPGVRVLAPRWPGR